MLLSIIIVNYNVKFFLEQCLCSVQAAISNINAEVLVIDNCSSDGSLEYLQPKFPWVIFLANNANTGFGKANNTALRQCRGAYVLYLNPDTIVGENCLDGALAFLAANPNAGAVGVRMVDGSGHFLPESKRAFPSPMVSFYKLSGLSSLFPKSTIFNRYALGFLPENGIHEADVLCGAFLMAPRNVVDALQGFDEAFFMYGEDIDLCYRIKQYGKKNYYLGHLPIVHFKGESSRRDAKKHIRVFYQAMSIFVKKHFTGSSASIMQFLLHAGILLRSAVSFIAAPFWMLVRKNVLAVTLKDKMISLCGDDTGTGEAGNILSMQYADIRIVKQRAVNMTEVPVHGTVVFCTGGLTYAAAIDQMGLHKDKYRYFWHGLHTKSVVGSSAKDITGTSFSYEGQS